MGVPLSISERTVEHHRSQVMSKLGIQRLAQLVRIKLEAELMARSEEPSVRSKGQN
ncbi:MAG TPA: LuxR C-terminal-related transcriptional regulator [Gammaproteobacteria bacterium]|nr:LuxR C-terminal-related transcriptional regulator [Gammaproteobacteria bacterium]